MINQYELLIVIHLYMQNKFFINYCSIENQLKNNCFEGVRYINYHNDLNKINILYYIKDLTNNYKEYIYLSNVLEKIIASINLGKITKWNKSKISSNNK